MKSIYLLIFIMLAGMLTFSFYGGKNDNPQSGPYYVGSQACVCHANILQTWLGTSHAKMHMTPAPGSIIGQWVELQSIWAVISGMPI